MSLICLEAVVGIYCSMLLYLHRKFILLLVGSNSKKILILLVVVALICLLQSRSLLMQEFYNNNNSNQIKTNGPQQQHDQWRSTQPNLVFHVGPPKTATTTIQETMLSYDQQNLLFNLDNYVYLGKIPNEYETNTENDNTNNRLHRSIPYQRTVLQRALRDPTCHLEMSRIREDYYANISATINSQSNNDIGAIPKKRPSLRDLLLELSCAERIVKSMERYSMNHTNILFSEELLSRDFRIPTTTLSSSYRNTNNTFHQNERNANGESNETYNSSNNNMTIRSKLDWVCLALLVQPYYKVTIIVTYRRYYEWLPSAKQQQERWTKRKKQWDTWPSIESAKISSYSNNINTPANTTFNDSDDDNITNIGNSGLVMEPLFPNYWKQIIPGQVVLYGNNFNKNISNIGITIVNDTSVYLSRQRQQHEWRQEQQQEQKRYASKIGSSTKKRKSSKPPGQSNEEITFWSNTIGISCHYTDTVLNSLRPLLSIYDTVSNNGNNDSLFDIKIFNLHALSSINNYTEPFVISTFFCDALPNATNLCHYSQENDRKEVLAKNSNTTTTGGRWNPSRSYTVYDQLVTAAYLSGKLSFQYVQLGRHQTVVAAQQYHQSLLSPPRTSNNITDEVTVHDDDTNTTNSNQDDNSNDDDDDTSNSIRNTVATGHGIMVPSHSSSARTTTKTKTGSILLLQEDLLRLQRENQLKNYSFIVSCPDRAELELYLQKSLRYEMLVFDATDVFEQRQQRHNVDFWYDAIVKKKFCSINTTATLQQKHWDHFFFSEPIYRYLD